MILFSIIIPTLNEAASIDKLLQHLEPIVKLGHELIIVDGGSSDETLLKCKPYTTKIFIAHKGRAKQMNIGAQYASNNILVFMHADTLIPVDFVHAISNSIDNSENNWGFFKVKLSGTHFALSLIALFMNIRSRLTGIATGDQTFFVSKSLFEKVNGFEEIPIMEDIELAKALKRHTRPSCLISSVTTSSRKWENNGIIKTVFLMWKIRLLYFFGVSPNKLVKLYYK